MGIWTVKKQLFCRRKNAFLYKPPNYVGCKKENAKIVTITAKEVGEPNPETRGLLGYTVPNQGDIKAFINDYSAGDKVYHFYGIPNYYIAKKQSDKNDCVICGTQNSSERDTCLNCGYSLIKADGIISFKKAPRGSSKPY